MQKLINIMIIILLLTGCVISSPQTRSSIEWSDIVVWNDKTYTFNGKNIQ
jgi:hypothetical protein